MSAVVPPPSFLASGGQSPSSTAQHLSYEHHHRFLRLITSLMLVLNLPLGLGWAATIRQGALLGNPSDSFLTIVQGACVLALVIMGGLLLWCQRDVAAFGLIVVFAHLTVALQMWQTGQVLYGGLLLPSIALAAMVLAIRWLIGMLLLEGSMLFLVWLCVPSVSPVVACALYLLMIVVDVTFAILGGGIRRIIDTATEAMTRAEAAASLHVQMAAYQRQFEDHLRVLGHDLRSPCDILCAFAEQLQQSDVEPSLYLYLLQQMKVSALRLRMRIDSMVDNAKAMGRTDLQEMDLSALLMAHVPSLRELAGTAMRTPQQRHGPTVHVDIHHMYTIRGRRAELQRILENLVANSTAAGAENIWISVQSTENGQVAVVIQDDGPGYPVSLIHQPLTTSYTTRPPGAGLGLVGVAANVAALGGTIQLSNWRAGVHTGARTSLFFPYIDT